MTKKVLTLVVALVSTVFFKAYSQTEEYSNGYEFEIIKELKSTSVKNQFRSGTCWSFSGISFLESELIRMGKPELNLSEAWIIRHSYSDKAIDYVRWQGNLNFGGGGGFNDITNAIKKYGIVTEEVYSGLNYGTNKFVHGELDAVLLGYMEQVIKNKNKELSIAWHPGFDGILDAYLGKTIESFKYGGNDFTPKIFATDFLGLNPDDYIEVTSFTHHPYYSEFILEIPDNWALDAVYNVELNDIIDIIDNSIEMGYTVAWGGDVSDEGFSWDHGVAIIADVVYEETSGTDKERLTGLTEDEKDEIIYSFEKPIKELEITPELRQKEFDNYNITDDHAMHIVGIAKDQNGNKYYKVKNSWDTTNLYNGFLFMSETYIKYKMTDMMIHKDVVPNNIAKKLKL